MGCPQSLFNLQCLGGNSEVASPAKPIEVKHHACTDDISSART